MKKNETAEKLTSAFMADDLFTDDSDLVSVIDAKETAEDAEKPHGTPWYLMAAFFLPIVLMYLIYIGMEVFPFGENSVLVLDMNGQYVYYFEYFREIIHGDASLLYSWTRTLGGEFLGIFAYYLSSPFTLIVALLPKAVMTESLLLLILAKIGTCGLCMAYYLKKSRHVGSYTAVLFGIMYALCAYGVIQAMNTMWIDAMYLLPIVLLGCERMILGKNPLLYCLTLAFLMLTNYYIGFMVCIFLVLYFFFYYFSQNELRLASFFKAGLRFALYSLIAAAIASIILIPAYYGLSFGKTTFQNTNYSFLQRFDFLDLLTKFLPASYDTVRPEGLPVVYSGLLTLLFAPLFFIAPGIRSREKAGAGIIVVLLILSMNASTVDIFWHGLSKPNWLNYRYSFILCFFLISLAARAFDRFEAVMEDAFSAKRRKNAPSPVNRIAFKALLVVAMALFAMIIVIQKEDYEYLNDFTAIWVSLAFLGAYLIALHPISCGRSKTAGKAFLLAICAGELFVSGLCDLIALDEDVVFSNRQPYANFMARFRPAVEQVLSNDDTLYRMEKTVHRKVNDNMALGIRGISHSTSDLNASVIKYLNTLGYASRSHWTKYLGGTPVSDALIGIKYLIAEEEVNALYEEVGISDDLFIYKNPYTLGIVNTVSADLLTYDTENYSTPFLRLNDLVTLMLGAEDTVELFKRIPVDEMDYKNCDWGNVTGHKHYFPENKDKTASISFMFDAPTTGEIFVFFPSDYPRDVDLKLNGEDWGTYFGNETRRIVSLGAYETDEEVTLEVILQEENLYLSTFVDYFYYLDEDLYREVMPQLQAYAMNITEWDNTLIEGTVTTDEEHTLIYTSIPYDEGWHVEIDGKEIPIIKTCDALIAIDASTVFYGEHDIRFSYMPDEYVYAFSICCGGTVLLLFSLLIRYLSKIMRERREFIRSESASHDAAETDLAFAELLKETEHTDTVSDTAIPPFEDISKQEEEPSAENEISLEESDISEEDVTSVLRDLFPAEEDDTDSPGVFDTTEDTDL